MTREAKAFIERAIEGGDPKFLIESIKKYAEADSNFKIQSYFELCYEKGIRGETLANIALIGKAQDMWELIRRNEDYFTDDELLEKLSYELILNGVSKIDTAESHDISYLCKMVLEYIGYWEENKYIPEIEEIRRALVEGDKLEPDDRMALIKLEGDFNYILGQARREDLGDIERKTLVKYAMELLSRNELKITEKLKISRDDRWTEEEKDELAAIMADRILEQHGALISPNLKEYIEMGLHRLDMCNKTKGLLLMQLGEVDNISKYIECNVTKKFEKQSSNIAMSIALNLANTDTQLIKGFFGFEKWRKYLEGEENAIVRPVNIGEADENLSKELFIIMACLDLAGIEVKKAKISIELGGMSDEGYNNLISPKKRITTVGDERFGYGDLRKIDVEINKPKPEDIITQIDMYSRSIRNAELATGGEENNGTNPTRRGGNGITH